MEIEKIKNLAEILQHLVISLSVIVTGVWVFFTFDALHQKEIALSELKEIDNRIKAQESLFETRKMKQEMELRKLTQETMENSALSASININKISTDGEKYLKIKVNVKNSGKDTIRLKLGKRVLAVSRVIFKEDGEMEFKNVQHLGYVRFSDTTKLIQGIVPFYDVDGSTSVEITFLAKVIDPGLYFITFSSSKTGEEVEKEKKENRLPTWVQYDLGVDDYILVN